MSRPGNGPQRAALKLASHTMHHCGQWFFFARPMTKLCEMVESCRFIARQIERRAWVANTVAGPGGIGG